MDVKPVQPVQMNIYQSNTNEKTWANFISMMRVWERYQVYDQQPYIHVSVAYQTYPHIS